MNDEPFYNQRETSRLLFDFSVMLSKLNKEPYKHPILDLGAGSCWISEFVAKMGYEVIAFDIHEELKINIDYRLKNDSRINNQLLKFIKGDAHQLPFEDNKFSNILCFDTLHHMHNFEKVFSEIYRTLVKGGRAIFVEPGARHSSSPETIKFVNEQKKTDMFWIERDIVIEEIDSIAKNSNFENGIMIVPLPYPLDLIEYNMGDWLYFINGEGKKNINNLQRLKYTDKLAYTNYYDRVIFYIEK